MRWLVFGIIVLIVIGVLTSKGTMTPPGPANPALNQDMRDYGLAPELTNTVWLNTDVPLRLADLRGKVVAIDMWTFG